MAGRKALPGKTVTSRVDTDLFNYIEDAHWKHKMTRPELIEAAIRAWAIADGYIPAYVAQDELDIDVESA